MTTKSLTDCYGRRLTVENGRPGIHVHASETVGPFTSEQLRTALDEVAPAGSYTRTDEEDWKARAEKAEQALTEIAQGGALTPDDIPVREFEAMADRALARWDKAKTVWAPRDAMREAMRAALTTPQRPEGAEDLAAAIAEWDETGVVVRSLDQADTDELADHLAALGYRKTP